jgi:hypothetical protein
MKGKQFMYDAFVAFAVKQHEHPNSKTINMQIKLIYTSRFPIVNEFFSFLQCKIP